jgi:two-component sensor histidine kinase
VPQQTKVIFILSVFGAFLGLLFSKRDAGLWTMIASLAIATFYFVIDPYVRIEWIQLSVLVTIISLGVVFLYLDRNIWLTLLFIGLLPTLNFLGYLSEATSLLRSGSFLGRGSISSLMVLSTGLYALYGWNQMIKRAKMNDEQMQSLLTNIEMLERSQSSQKYWRELVIRVHETTLNTIRSLLTLRDKPLDSFREVIDKTLSQSVSMMSRAQERRSGSVIGAIRAGIDGAALEEKVRIISQGVNLHLDSEVAEAIERAVHEALRNAVEHAQAKNIEIHWRTTTQQMTEVHQREQGRVVISIRDDGSSSTNQKFGGIGTSLVMAKSIRDLGGSLEINRGVQPGEGGTVVRIEVPTVVQSVRSGVIDFPSFSAVDLGRYMALLTLFGPAITGIYFFPLLGMWWPGHWISRVLGFACLSYLLYRAFIRVKQMGWSESIGLALGLLGIIFFLDLNPLTCESAQPIQWIFNSVVFGLFLIFLWGKWQVTVLAYPIFIYLIAPMHNLVPQECNFIINFPLLNTLFSFLFVAVIFTVVYKTFEKVENFQELRRAKNSILVSEIEKNDAAFEKILELDTFAQKNIREIVGSGGLLNSSNEHSLRRIDAQLRAEIQIDPIGSSGFTLLAVEFVQHVVDRNHWLDVRSIHGDEDSRPLPELIRNRFMAIAEDLRNGSSIQVIVGEEHAEISLRSRGEVPESVAKLKQIVESLKDSELSLELSVSSSEEFVLIMRRKRSSQ